MAVAYVDRIGTNPTLAAPYSLGDPTITVDFCPPDVSAKDGEFPITVGSVLFRVSRPLGAGDVVWSVTRDTRTMDQAQVVGTPVLVQFSGWQIEELRDRPIEETLTAETDTTLVLAPDGAGGVEFRAETGGMTNPMTTQDDLIVGGASGTPARLAKGSDGDVLTVDPTTHHLVWAAPSGGSASPLTTKGDLWGYDTADNRVPVGTDGDVLTADSGAAAGVSWQAPAGGASGHYEIIVVAGGGPPPDFLTTPDGSDYLYGLLP